MNEPPPSRNQRIAAALLVGGVGRRFGSDKVDATIGGLAMLTRALAAVIDFTPQWLIAGTPERAAALRARLPKQLSILPDDHPQQGPLGGVATALRLAAAADCPRVVVLAVDLPLLTRHWWPALLAQADAGISSALVARDPDGRYHPLAALYRSDQAAAAATQLAAGERSIQRFLQTIGATAFTPDAELLPMLRNVNTPAEAVAVNPLAPAPSTLQK